MDEYENIPHLQLSPILHGDRLLLSVHQRWPLASVFLQQVAHNWIYYFSRCHYIQEPSSTGCVRAATVSSCAQYTAWFWWFHLFSCGSVSRPCGAITRWSLQPPPQQPPPQTQLSQLCVNFKLRIVPFIACVPSFKPEFWPTGFVPVINLLSVFKSNHFIVRCNVCSATILHRCTVGLVSQYSSSSACSGSSVSSTSCSPSCSRERSANSG